MPHSSVQVGRHVLGPGQPCFLVAEIGINHNGDAGIARESCAAASAAGADAVKFQNYRTEDFLSDRRLTYTYTSRGQTVTEPQWDMFKRCEVGRDWLADMAEYCRSLGLSFFSTPTSKSGVDDLVAIGSDAIKNGSDFLTNTPLLEYMASTSLPVIISTGMADQSDVDAAMHALTRGGSEDIVVLHCTSAYPTPVAEVNLRRMLALRSHYDVPVGFSDHTVSWEAAAQAVTLGAVMVERHFTIDHDLPGPDQWFSSTPDEFSTLVRQVRAAEQRLGGGAIAPAAVEAAARAGYRLSIVAAAALPTGTVLDDRNVAFRRPGTGLSPDEFHRLDGKRLKRAVDAGQPIRIEDVD